MKSRLVGRDFLTLMDFSKEEVEYFLDTAAELKRKRRIGEPHEYLRGRTVACLFEKHSTRTRTSFQAGIAHLGAQSFYMRSDELQLARGEPIKDTARVIDRYCDALVIRTFAQERVEEFAQYMENPVINALTDLTHPCQILADLLTIREKKGSFKGLKMAFTGDIWNVCHSLLVGSSMMGMDLYIARPEGYNPNGRFVKFAHEQAKKTGSKIVITTNLGEAVADADIVYSVAWYSMGQENIEQKKKEFATYRITEELLTKAKKDAVYMNCLPCHREEEMTDEVLEGLHSVVWDEAENRIHTEKAVLSLLVS